MYNLFTIGYESLSLDQFIQRLRDHRVECVVDVRELPASRKAGFSKTKLSAALESAGIHYESIRALGSPRPLRKEFRKTHDWEHFSSEYRKHLKGQQAVLERLIEHVYSERVCLMCFEKDSSVCHRSIVAQKAVNLADNGFQVKHL